MTTALTKQSASPPAQITGSAKHWARDMAIVGGVTSFIAPMSALLLSSSAQFMLFDLMLSYAMVASFLGAASGALLGLAMPTYLNLVRKWLPLPVLFVGHPIIGAIWGGTVGLLAAIPSVGVVLGVLPALLGAIVGALQFGWLWFPYTFQTVLDGRRWPLVALSGVVALVAPWLAYLVLLL